MAWGKILDDAEWGVMDMDGVATVTPVWSEIEDLLEASMLIGGVVLEGWGEFRVFGAVVYTSFKPDKIEFLLLSLLPLSSSSLKARESKIDLFFWVWGSIFSSGGNSTALGGGGLGSTGSGRGMIFLTFFVRLRWEDWADGVKFNKRGWYVASSNLTPPSIESFTQSGVTIKIGLSSALWYLIWNKIQFLKRVLFR